MKTAVLLAFGLMLPDLAAAQESDVVLGKGVLLRGIDKVSGYVTDLEIANGEVADFERLSVELGECRHPADDAALDAYAFLTIRDKESGEEFFSGWMLASSPALNAMEHPRYDVWVLRCKTQ